MKCWMRVTLKKIQISPSCVVSPLELFQLQTVTAIECEGARCSFRVLFHVFWRQSNWEKSDYVRSTQRIILLGQISSGCSVIRNRLHFKRSLYRDMWWRLETVRTPEPRRCGWRRRWWLFHSHIRLLPGTDAGERVGHQQKEQWRRKHGEREPTRLELSSKTQPCSPWNNRNCTHVKLQRWITVRTREYCTRTFSRLALSDRMKPHEKERCCRHESVLFVPEVSWGRAPITPSTSAHIIPGTKHTQLASFLSPYFLVTALQCVTKKLSTTSFLPLRQRRKWGHTAFKSRFDWEWGSKFTLMLQ